jgi:hypothetical protein
MSPLVVCQNLLQTYRQVVVWHPPATASEVHLVACYHVHSIALAYSQRSNVAYDLNLAHQTEDLAAAST